MIMPILGVKSVNASVDFYTSKLGFEKQVAFDGEDGNLAFAIVISGENHIGLSLDENPAGASLQFMVYVTADSDIDQYYADVQARGATISEEIKTEYWGDRVFSLRDLDGYLLTFSKTVEETDMEKVSAIMKGEQPA